MSLFLEYVEENIDYSPLEKRIERRDFDVDYEAKRWAEENGMHLIYCPYIEWTEDEEHTDQEYLDILEELWHQFNSQYKKLRRTCDWQLMQLTGYNNYQYYIFFKRYLMEKDKFHNGYELKRSEYDPKTNAYLNTGVEIYNPDKPVIVSEMVEDSVNYDAINYTELDVMAAISWATENNRVVIVPCDSLDKLEEQWYNFNSMILKHRRESDWFSMETFGITNQQHYNFLKSNLMKKDDVAPVEIQDINEAASLITIGDKRRFGSKYLKNKDINLLELATNVSKIHETLTSDTEKRLFDKEVEDTIDKNNKEGRYVSSTYIPYGDMPFFTPDEMIDFGVFNPVDADNYFGVQADNTVLEDGFSVKKWFENYQYNFIGVPTVEGSTMAPKWLRTMQRLYSDFGQIKESGDKKTINARMQSILEMGWNPYIDFTTENRVNAGYRTGTILDRLSTTYEFVDARYLDTDIVPVAEGLTKEKKDIKPIFVLLIGGHTMFSDLVKKATHSKYSHAAISLDTSMENIYSFGMSDLERLHGKTSLPGGLTHENIKKYAVGTPVSIFGFFVKQKDYDLIKKNLDWFIENAEKTRYSFQNLLAYLFKIPLVKNTKFICSQFVDRILKLSNIDITGVNSAFIAPSDLEKKAKQNSKIYQMFEGLASDFKEKNLNKIVKRIGSKADPIKEQFITLLRNNLVSESLTSKILEEVDLALEEVKPLTEARSIPIEFDDDGNLILHGDIMSVDYEAEYSKSHKILMAAEESKSYETMKYELAKLWMLNIILEKKLHGNRVSEKNRNEWNNARARVLNDFKKYIDIVMKNEPSFNFSRYYEESPFNTNAIKISKNTIRYTAATLKRLLTSNYTSIIPFDWI